MTKTPPKKKKATTSQSGIEALEQGRYATPSQFVVQFSEALEDFLTHTYGTGKEQYIEDLGWATATFAKAFVHIVAHF
jgi:hypothetical protein